MERVTLYRLLVLIGSPYPVRERYSFGRSLLRRLEKMFRRLTKMSLALVLGDSLLCVLIVALPFLSPPLASGAETPKKVLIFSSEDSYLPAITILNQAIRTTLISDSPVRVQFYNEAQDSYRIANEKYEEELVRLLQRKYDGEHIDLIYVLSTPALKFLLKHRSELFSLTPVVFIVVDQSQVGNLNLGSQVTGVSGKVELRPTLDIALALQPQTQRVVVVAGNASLDNALMEQAHREFRPYEGRVEFTYLAGLPIEALRTKLASLTDKSIVFYLSFLSDSARVYTGPEALSLFAQSSSAPIYGASQTYMGSGIVGGRLISFEALGTCAAETGLRILAGESPQNIPPETVPSVTMFDWREVRRWGLDESKLPTGSIVLFQEPTFWEHYKWRIIGVVSLCILEAFLIVWLLISRARRRQAEQENKRLAQVAEAERRRLDEVMSNVPGVVWESRIEPGTNVPKTHFVSDYVEKMLGYSVEEWCTPGFALMVVPEEDRERVARETEAILESGKAGILQFRWLAKDGSLLWVEAQATAICDAAGKTIGLRGVTMDITDRKRAEEARHLSEERLTQAISVARFGVFEHDHLTGILHSSPLTREIHAWGEEDTSSLEGLVAQLHLEDRESFIAAVSRAHDPAGDGFFSNEYRIVLAGGEVRWLSARAQTLFEGEGVARRPVRTIGAELDITERKQAEEALGESEARYRNVVETQTELICRYLPDSTLTFVNDAYCRYFGKTRAELIGAKFVNLIPPYARDAALSHVASLVENPRSETHEHEVLLPGGGTGWQQWINHVVKGSNGNGNIELQGIGRDTTERRRAEEALRVSESRFRTMADSAPLLIWMCGPDNLCTYVNQGWLEFTGRTIEQELGKGWAEGIFGEDRARCWDSFNSAFDRREPLNMEYRLRRADGVFRWVYVSAAPRFTSESEFLGYIGSCIDIADRKEAEEALRKAHEEVSKLKNQLQAENIYLQEEIKLSHNVDEIVGRSNAIKYVLFKVEQVGHTDTTVIILGETGTGKELVARAIHNQSLRKDRPLVKVNCAALTASLIESELFGHEKGAFTGASARKIGRFELANGATIFLDEIGELPLELQAKLLRVVQEGEFERLGSSRTIKVDVRIIAATNRNMKLEVEKGTFREDLWYRLNVFPITVPPLRQRKEDIPPMVEHFVGSLSKKLGKTITSISSATVQKLLDYSWPGNVRELANVIERAVVNAQGPVLHISDQFEQSRAEELSSSTKSLEEMEKEYITRILDQTAWRIEGQSGAARILGLNPSTLRTRMVKLGIQKSMRSFAGSSGVRN
jgi:PAS domain S-box-containing protein